MEQYNKHQENKEMFLWVFGVATVVSTLFYWDFTDYAWFIGIGIVAQLTMPDEFENLLYLTLTAMAISILRQALDQFVWDERDSLPYEMFCLWLGSLFFLIYSVLRSSKH